MSDRRVGRAAGGGRLDRVAAEVFPDLSRSRVAALIKAGAVQVDGRVVTRPSASVAAGQALTVDVPEPIPAEARPQDLPLDVVYEDEDLAVIDKAAGMVVHPAAGHPDGTLVNALLHHLDGLSGVGGVQRPGIVHRLDKGTSGLLVVAKHDAAHAALAAQFADHSASRRYLAVVHGVPAEVAGTVRSRLARHPTDRRRFASTADPERGKPAVTHWRRLGAAHDIAVLECRLETGRTHQVRVHCTELGHPLVGDPMYRRRGRRLPAVLQGLVAPDRPLLHAWRLDLTHPTSGCRQRFVRPPPEDFMAVLEALGLADVVPVSSRPRGPGPA